MLSMPTPAPQSLAFAGTNFSFGLPATYQMIGYKFNAVWLNNRLLPLRSHSRRSTERDLHNVNAALQQCPGERKRFGGVV